MGWRSLCSDELNHSKVFLGLLMWGTWILIVKFPLTCEAIRLESQEMLLEVRGGCIVSLARMASAGPNCYELKEFSGRSIEKHIFPQRIIILRYFMTLSSMMPERIHDFYRSASIRNKCMLAPNQDERSTIIKQNFAFCE
jgi:hypothetical protein